VSSIHLSEPELELYVIDGLDAIRAARVEAHVSECESCAASLAREARFELSFTQLAYADERITREAARKSAARIRHPRVVAAGACGGAVSLAAAWLMWVGAPVDASRAGAFVEPEIQNVRDADGVVVSAVDEPHAHDLLDGG
jgi:predicted anti-sigma-YlaC factor YlaD